MEMDCWVPCVPRAGKREVETRPQFRNQEEGLGSERARESQGQEVGWWTDLGCSVLGRPTGNDAPRGQV